MGRKTGNPSGRPKGDKERFRCAAGDECLQKEPDGSPGWVERYPSQVEAAKTKRFFHNEACRNAKGTRQPMAMAKGVCENPTHEELRPGIPREFEYPAKRKRQRDGGNRFCTTPCYLAAIRTPLVEFACGWCGGIIRDFAANKRAFHSTEAPEPPCGWPDGVRMTCWDLGRFKHLAEPLRFVNGKPVRMWKDRRRGIERAQVWDPSVEKADKWVFEHRYNWEQEHGVKLTPDVYIHHDDEDKTNNEVSNAKSMTPSEHTALHNARRNEKLAAAEAALAKLAKYEQKFGSLDEPDPDEEKT